jgi:hypothetical protein
MSAIHIGVAGIAKQACNLSPFVIVNELVCSYLSRAIILPSPPGFIIENEGSPHYVSMNFNLAEQRLPPVDPPQLVELQPHFSAGVLAFDIWVLNSDRHDENLSHFVAAGKAQAFDHGHCFFNGSDSNEAHQYLENNRNSLGIDGHCLLPYLDRLDFMIDWIYRIEQVPDFYIREVVMSTVVLGLPQTEVDYCIDYLCQRRDTLRQLVMANRNSFPAIQGNLWDPFTVGGRP